MTNTYAQVMGQKRDRMIGRPLFEIFPDNPEHPNAAGVRNLGASLDRVSREKVAHTMAIQRLEGSYWRPINTPVLDGRGELRYIVHAVEDVTDLVRLDTERGDAVTALEASNEELEGFCYSISHDLRAPLRGIQGFSQALLEDYSASVDPKGQEYLKRVSSAALRMSELIDDLLALSRISRGPLVRGPVDLTAIATTTAGDLARTQGRQVKTTIGDGLKANADPRLLQIVFDNLLGNAWKFTSKVADPSVEVGSESIDGTVQFFVRDNGAGFDPAYASKLFAPFQRLHSDKAFPGTGIGLATVQRIVRRHGGRVWANAALNQGAVFYFTLPD